MATARLSTAGALWTSRELLWSLVTRNLRVKYQRSMLGFVWTFLNPLVTVAILLVVFTRIVRIPLEHYWAFLLSGYFTWNFLSLSVNASALMLGEHKALLRSVAFPAEVTVLAAVLSRGVEFLIELAVVLVLLGVFHHGGIPASFAWLPLLLVLQLLVTLGLALPVATISVFYADVVTLLPALVTALFYASPVFYPLALVPEALQPLYLLNPVAALLDLYHAVLWAGTTPPLAGLAWRSAAFAALAGLGYALFNRRKPVFAEVV